jgi:hypothetical protein
MTAGTIFAGLLAKPARRTAPLKGDRERIYPGVELSKGRRRLAAKR